MNATLWVQILLGSAILITGFFSIYTNARDRGRSVRKQETGLQIDEATRNEIAARSASLNSEEIRKMSEYWKGEFKTVKDELAEERDARKAAEKENQEWRKNIAKQLREHQPWDDYHYQRDPSRGEPPLLDPDPPIST